LRSMTYKLNCQNCQTPFSSHIKTAKYCSRECRSAYWKDRSYIHHNSSLSTGTVGAISELRVSADLLLKGYEVFRSVSQSASCDLAVLKNKQLLRVEVRSGYEKPNGGFYTNRANFRADILATVTKDRIIYEPTLESLPESETNLPIHAHALE